MIRVFNHYFHAWTLRRIAFDLALAMMALIAVMLVHDDGRTSNGRTLAGAHVLSLAAGMFLINAASGLYQRTGPRSIIESCVRAMVALTLALTLTYQIFSLMPTEFSNAAAVRVSAMLVISMVILRRVAVAHWVRQTRNGSRVLILGTGPAAQMVGATIKTTDPLARIAGYFPGPNERQSELSAAERLETNLSLTDTARKLGVDEIVVALTERRSGSMPMRELLDCKLAGIRVYDVTTYFERMLGQIRLDYVNAGWLIFGDGFNQGWYRTTLKRTFDVVCSMVLISISAPAMLLAAIAIKLESRGPVLYRQERVGANGRVFEVIKFRSMRADAEKDGTPVWAVKHDSRITRVGHAIRKSRIDELPQLFNVLKGEMSLVGPRPERPYFVEQLKLEIPYYSVRHSIKPGVTGWAQVKYQYGSTVEDSAEKLQYDLYYVKNHSLFLDFVVLFETIGVVLTGKGAR